MQIEPAVERRQLRTIETQSDLVVIGGGLAGVCCAITAARAGISVTLIQDRPVLGGNSSSEVRLWVLGATSHMGNNNRWAREGGVNDEILVENMYRNREGNSLIFDTILLEKVVEEPNITLLLNTAVYEVEKADADVIAGVPAMEPVGELIRGVEHEVAVLEGELGRVVTAGGTVPPSQRNPLLERGRQRHRDALPLQAGAVLAERENVADERVGDFSDTGERAADELDIGEDDVQAPDRVGAAQHGPGDAGIPVRFDIHVDGIPGPIRGFVVGVRPIIAQVQAPGSVAIVGNRTAERGHQALQLESDHTGLRIRGEKECPNGEPKETTGLLHLEPRK